MNVNNILLIGGAGFIGSSILKYFYSTEYKEYYNFFVLEPEFSDISRIQKYGPTIIRLSLDDTESINKILTENNISVVIHLASQLLPSSSGIDFQREVRSIIHPSIKIIQLCSHLKIKFIYFSSGGTVYGNIKTSLPLKENNVLMPISYYGLSKKIFEDIIYFEHLKNELEFLILRPSNPYGPGQNINGNQGLIAIVLGKLIKNESITIYGTGQNTRDYIYIDDLAYCIFSLIHNNVKNKVLNIGSGIGNTINEVIDIISTILNKKEVSIERLSSRSTDVDGFVLDISELQSLINYTPTSIIEGIESFYKFLIKEMVYD